MLIWPYRTRPSAVYPNVGHVWYEHFHLYICEEVDNYWKINWIHIYGFLFFFSFDSSEMQLFYLRSGKPTHVIHANPTPAGKVNTVVHYITSIVRTLIKTRVALWEKASFPKNEGCSCTCGVQFNCRFCNSATTNWFLIASNEV